MLSIHRTVQIQELITRCIRMSQYTMLAAVSYASHGRTKKAIKLLLRVDKMQEIIKRAQHRLEADCPFE